MSWKYGEKFIAFIKTVNLIESCDSLFDLEDLLLLELVEELFRYVVVEVRFQFDIVIVKFIYFCL